MVHYITLNIAPFAVPTFNCSMMSSIIMITCCVVQETTKDAIILFRKISKFLHIFFL